METIPQAQKTGRTRTEMQISLTIVYNLLDFDYL